jgi:hypothetical protein
MAHHCQSQNGTSKDDGSFHKSHSLQNHTVTGESQSAERLSYVIIQPIATTANGALNRR